jgi:hypothetical protein
MAGQPNDQIAPPRRVSRLILAAVALVLATATTARAAPPVRIGITFIHHSHPSTLSILASARPRIIGRVTAVTDGHGVAGVRVAVVERFTGHPATVGAARVSGPHGLFSILLPRGGARVVGVVGGGAASNLLSIETATAVTLAAAPTRVRAPGVVAFAGNVAGVTSRLIVALQVRTTHGYQTFEIVRSRPDGGFAGRYRFSLGGFHYAFRAVVVAQNGFYAQTGMLYGRSQSNTVTVDVL